jgi:hypothetical protein
MPWPTSCYRVLLDMRRDSSMHSFADFIGATYENQTFQITGASEPMAGEFQLLYDDADGTRRQLTSWSLQLEAGGLSAALTSPQLAPETPKDTPCWLVFRGQLGAESGAVAMPVRPHATVVGNLGVVQLSLY